ncbi:MAG TPA: ribosome maturation factor RimM [Micromonosporaceae bacterium]|nr:ribosome maturation factor RimM [Micromonosporaceae bacterium]
MQLIVGRIVRPHGVRGEVVVEVRTDSPEERFRPGSVLRTEPEATGPLRVEHVRSHQARLLVVFEGIYDRDVAENLRGVTLWVDSADVPEPTDPDEFLDHQLIGLRAETPAGERLGDVVAIDHAPASDLLVLRLPDGRDAMVPFVRAIVPEVDLAGGRLVVTAPEGLLDL